ncbi:hypothetical protein KKA03_02500 [archaeon]|nr:hypothetical protein [archaeon]
MFTLTKLATKRTEKATEKRMEMAREVDSIVIQHLKDKPSSTIYDISKDLGWTVGKVQGSIIRIKDSLVVEDSVENGRLKRKYDFLVEVGIKDGF